MYKIVDNFLSPIQFKMLKAHVFSARTQWTFMKNVTNNVNIESNHIQDSWRPGLSRSIYMLEGLTESNEGMDDIHDDTLWNLIQPLVNHDLGLVMRAKLGFMFGCVNEDFQIHNAHVDWNEPHITQLYYVTDSVAPTYLYKEKQTEPNTQENFRVPAHEDLTIMHKCEHKANSCLFFDGSHYHASTSSLKPEIRINININYATETPSQF